jgi:hypothetical protein
MSVTASLAAGDAPVILKTGPRMVGSIASGEGLRIPFTLTVMPGAAEGDYLLPLTLTYTVLSSEEMAGTGSVIYRYSQHSTEIPVLVRIDEVVRVRVRETVAANLTAGGEGYLTLLLENTGSLAGTGAVARISRADESPVIPVTSTVYVGDFPPGGLHACRFKVRIDGTAERATYPLQVTVDYRGRSGEALTTRNEIVGVPVAGKMTFSIDSGDIVVYRGSRSPIEVTIRNTGPSSVSSAQARISAVEPFTGYRDIALIGDLGPGEERVARFEVGVSDTATVKQYGLDAEIRYRDGVGQERISDPLTVQIEVRERPGIFRFLYDPVFLSVIAALSIGLVYYLSVYRKQKREKPEE